MNYNSSLGRELYQSVETLTEIFCWMKHFHMDTHGRNIRTALTIRRTADLQLEPSILGSRPGPAGDLHLLL